MNIGDSVVYTESETGEHMSGVIMDVFSSIHDTVELRSGIPYYISKKMSAAARRPVYRPVKLKNLPSVFMSVISRSGRTDFLLLDEVTAL